MGARRSRTVAAIVAASGLLVACGGSSAQRTGGRVAAYLRQVNVIERQLAAPLATVTRMSATVGRASGAGAQGSAQVATVLAAEAWIRRLGGRLAGLPAPAPAAHLRTLLVRLVDGQAQLTDQTARLIAYLPALRSELRPLSHDLLALERVLALNQANGAGAVQTVYAHKAAALRTFAGQVGRIAGRLRRIHPPSVALPDYRAQLHSLDGMGSAAGRLAGDLTSAHTSAIGGPLRQFDRAAAATGTVALQRAQLAAVRAYDRQVQQLTVLSAPADAERLSLARTY